MATNAQGFTDYAGLPALYVNPTTGNDANSGLVSTAPKRTMAAAYAAMSNGNPMAMLLARGSTFSERVPKWDKSGRAIDAPIMLGAYGNEADPCPRVVGDGQPGFEVYNRTLNFVTVQSIEFDSGRTDWGSQHAGLDWMGSTWRGILFEDCGFSHYSGGAIIRSLDKSAGNLHGGDINLRRCRILDNFSHDHSQGLYCCRTDALRLEDTILDGNGWRRALGTGDSLFAHNTYLHKEVGFNFVNVISARASSNGLSTGTGGSMTDCLVVECPLGLVARPAGTALLRVVVTGTRAIAGSPRGFGMELQAPWGNDDGDSFLYGPTPTGPLTATDCWVAHSGQNWGNPAYHVFAGSNPTLTNAQKYHWESQNDASITPPRTLESYATSLGLAASKAAFLDRARLNRRGNWDDRFTAKAAIAWMSGMGVVTPPPPPPPPLPTPTTGSVSLGLDNRNHAIVVSVKLEPWPPVTAQLIAVHDAVKASLGI